ncbi:hypothetical protein PT2222_100309 [Paraburkholderia tropica]
MLFEFRLGVLPERVRLVVAAQAARGEPVDERARIVLGGGREHEAVALQRLERAHERGAVHHEVVGKFGGGGVGAAREARENSELRGRHARLREMALIELRDEARRLPQCKTVAFLARHSLRHCRSPSRASFAIT